MCQCVAELLLDLWRQGCMNDCRLERAQLLPDLLRIATLLHQQEDRRAVWLERVAHVVNEAVVDAAIFERADDRANRRAADRSAQQQPDEEPDPSAGGRVAFPP